MKRFPLVISVLLAGMVAFGLWACVSGVHVFRYRLTIYATCDGHEVSGSGVVQVEWYDVLTRLFPFIVQLQQGAYWDIGVRGEAAAVDLCSDGTLFSLLKEDPARHFDDPVNGPASFVMRLVNLPWIALRPGASDETSLNQKSINVPLNDLPMLVRFRNINDPKSVELVEPDNLTKAFGPGVSLVRATIESVSPGVWPFYLFGITNGVPLTKGIDDRLPWLTSLEAKKATLDGDTSIARKIYAPLDNMLGTEYFARGE